MKIRKFNEDIDLGDEDWEEEDENFEPVLRETEPMHFISTGDMIAFIEKNSDMEWNYVCDFVRRAGIINDDGDKKYWSVDDLVDPDDYNEDINKWVGGFFKAHPWIKHMVIVFDD